MGVLNCTPDSFSDGGLYFGAERAVEKALRMAEEGAGIIDIGGESTRPGAEPVPLDEELRRTIPVVEALARQTDIPVSIDTTKAAVAEKALEKGACIINDISAMRFDEGMMPLAASSGCGCVLMHMRGTPETMQSMTKYGDVVREIRGFLLQRAQTALDNGIGESQLCLDPGIGFGKTFQQNLVLINRLDEIRIPGIPLLAGVSRKGFIGAITGAEARDRLWGTAGAVAAAILRGADIVRVHDPGAIRDVAAVAAAVRRESVQ